MSRFANLEFGEQPEERAESTPLLKDEAYYLSEARQAYENARFEQGLRAYAKVLEFNPQSPEAWTGQVRMLIELGEFHEAKVWADKALESLPNHAELLAAKAVALARTGDLAGALAFSDAAIEERGNTPFIWLARGDVLLARKERHADYCFDKALALSSYDWFILWLASRIYYYYRQFSNALRMAQRAIESFALGAILWLQLGQCQLALDLVAPARHSFEQARQLDPACEGLHGALARLQHAGPFTALRGWIRHLFHP